MCVCRDNGADINAAVSDIFTRYHMTQHVDLATHNSGHTLDLMVTSDDDSILPARPSVKSLCFSDHYLVSSQLRLNRDVPVPVTYMYCPLRRMDINSFRCDLRLSSLFLDDANITADDYADLIDAEVTRVLDIHAPLRMMRKRQDKHDCRWLSVEARAAKRKQRGLERRYRKTRCAKDKQEYTAAAKEAKTLITRSRSVDITQRLNKVTGDSPDTWRVAQQVLHSKPRQFYDDSECAQLINAFSDLFTNKLQTIRDTIGAALKSCALQQFRGRVYDGQPLANLQPVTAGDVMKTGDHACKIIVNGYHANITVETVC